MCGCSADPTSPPAPNRTPSGGTGTCCWCTAHTKDVSRMDSDYVTSTQISPVRIKWHLKIDFPGNTVTVTTVFKWGTIARGVTEAHKTAIKDALKNRVTAVWSNNYSLKVTDATCNPTEKTIPIRFRILWDDETTIGHHYNANVKVGPATSDITGFEANFDTLDTDNNSYTLCHEYGHTLGLHDEYFYGSNTSGTVTYKRANGTTEAITLPQSGNMMATSGDFTMKKRFQYFVEIEAQELLRSAAGLGKAGITCEVV
ncbi:MAG: hypothetical protein MUE98_09220 [Rhodobacteraceae bacterium]|jgi:hypothetical protein|nr:hypothetical protein [Paracoccaceae bacterium]